MGCRHDKISGRPVALFIDMISINAVSLKRTKLIRGTVYERVLVVVAVVFSLALVTRSMRRMGQRK